VTSKQQRTPSGSPTAQRWIIAGVTVLILIVVILVRTVPDDHTSDQASATANSSPTSMVTSVTPSATSPEQTAASDAQKNGVVLIDSLVTATEKYSGTGIVIDSSGLVLTNHHVVDDPDAPLQVVLPLTGEVFSAEVLGHDAANDIALLRMQGASGLNTAAIDNDAVVPGDEVTAIGNAEGAGTLMAATGELLAIDQEVTTGDGAGSLRTLTGTYQTSCRALHGYSGGPNYDSEGEVIGLTVAGGSATHEDYTTSYVVPISTAVAIANQIRQNSPTGSIVMGP